MGIDEWAAGAVPDLAGPASVAAFLLAVELDALFIALASGHLLLLDTSPASAAASRLEEVGCVAGGVRGAAWSPDGAALALVSGAGQLLLMTQVRAREALASSSTCRGSQLHCHQLRAQLTQV